MSGLIADLPPPIYKALSPQRPKDQMSRSVTEAPVPKNNRPHHQHHPHIHRHHRDPKEKESLSPHPSSQLNTTVIDGTKSEGVTPEESNNPSRRTSLLASNAEIDGLLITSSWKEERRLVREREVDTEKEKGAVQATELRNALNNLNTLSNTTTRRLDNTYYSVLEKLSILQSTVTSLKELAGLTRVLNEEFKQASEEVVTEVETSLNGFEGFEAQQRRIEGLAARVKNGREKIKTLGDRVELVKERVDGWERSEGEWQERTRKRLKLLWIIVAGCGVVIFGLLAFQYAPARTQGPAALKGMNASAFAGAVSNMEKVRNETWDLKRSTGDALERMKAQSEDKQKAEDDPRLRVFDEL